MRRKIEQYANCDPYAVIRGSHAQVLYFIKDAKADIVDQHAYITALEEENKRLREALKNLVAAEDRYVDEAGVELDDPISDAVEIARAALETKS
jgi:hypothetical protein